MPSISRPISSNRILRSTIQALTVLLVAIWVFDAVLWGLRAAGILLPANNGIYFFQTEYAGFWLVFQSWLILSKLLLYIVFALLMSTWLYRGVRNLRRMGLHTHLEPRWIILSWVIAPLLVFNYALMTADLITRQSHLYQLLGRRAEDKILSGRQLQTRFRWFWRSMWLTIIFMVLGGTHELPELLVEDSVTQAYLSLVFLNVPVLLGMAMSLRYVRAAGRLEERVALIWDRGDLTHWREEQLKTGHLIADHSESPDWYLQPESLSLDGDEKHIFQDQNRGDAPAFE